MKLVTENLKDTKRKYAKNIRMMVKRNRKTILLLPLFCIEFVLDEIKYQLIIRILHFQRKSPPMVHEEVLAVLQRIITIRNVKRWKTEF